MSIDIKFQNLCDHRIIDFDMPVSGISPNFIGQLDVPCVGNTNLIFIRSYDSEQDATYINNYNIGITNYIISDDRKQILFGIDQVTSGQRFPDVFEGQIPYNKYLIDYTVKKEECPRCLGSGIVGDMAFDVSGKLVTVTGTEKLKQEVIKILLSDKNINPYHLEYGSNLNELIGGELTEFTLVVLQKYINDSMVYLATKQSTLDLPSEERFLRIESLILNTDASDPTKCNVKMTFLSYAFEESTVSLSIILGGS